MSSLVGGRYVIEYVTYDNLDDLGGMYITRKGVQEPLFMAPQVPPLIEQQDWKVTRGSDGSNTYILTRFFDGPGADGFSWKDENPDTIILDEPRQFTLNQVPPEDVGGRQDIYWIRPVTFIIGVDRCVGRDDRTEEVRVYTFPIEAPLRDRPIWKFRAIN
ncbi:peptidase inhibitor clitocypin-domain-containing protein [Infundibulicybe gibba]|nr:peptidase inhibitor clitocypin-domain-containing protein [Infundibulicybe gibba]